MSADAYEAGLVAYACRSGESRGRRYPEAESQTRNPFQRDRDRIIHSTGFRRLEYKTQVFVNHEGDHYRTRLAHDLGHTPFGHSGQDALNSVMQAYGGFEHNRQSLRIVENLEKRYIAFPGLNLTYETREGLVKHHSPHDTPRNQDLAEYHLDEQSTLEAQIGNLSDEVAYNNHDVDDGLRAGILHLDGLREVELFRRHLDEVEAEYAGVDERLKATETIRRMINFLIMDVIRETRLRIEQAGIASLGDVRASGKPLVGFSREVRQMNGELKKYLFRNMYHHYRVMRMATKAERVVKDMFHAYMEHPAMLPEGGQHRIASAGAEGRDEGKKARVIADYIAGMTDRYALEEYDRLFNVHART